MSRKTERKWFWVWEFEKEEAWLNDMAAQGWALDGVGFCRYEFKACGPGEYGVRLELMEQQPHTPEGQEYIAFVEETGAEYVGHYMRWAYFRKRTEEGGFDLFSDLQSRIGHIDRIMKLVGLIALVNLLIGTVSVNAAGWINLACAALLGYACWRLREKKERLKKERQLHE